MRKPTAPSFISEHFAILSGEAVALGPAQHCLASLWCYSLQRQEGTKSLLLPTQVVSQVEPPGP